MLFNNKLPHTIQTIYSAYLCKCLAPILINVQTDVNADEHFFFGRERIFRSNILVNIPRCRSKKVAVRMKQLSSYNKNSLSELNSFILLYIYRTSLLIPNFNLYQLRFVFK